MKVEMNGLSEEFRKTIVSDEIDRMLWDNKPSIPDEILLFCLKNKFPNIPECVTINIKGNKTEQSIPLFQYVLRMSFWRPRDILEYYAAILSYVGSYHDDNVKKKLLKKW